MFHLPEPFDSAGVLLEEPSAEALANTINIGMYTYDTKIDEETSELSTVDISVMKKTKITFSPAAGSVQFDEQYLEEQHAQLVRVDEVYSQHAVVQIAWDENEATLPIKLRILGNKTETTQTMPKAADMDTLLLDSGIANTVPSNLDTRLIRSTEIDPNTFYYTDWYGAKFKYKCKTRNEYLVNAGDIVLFETPFSNNEPNRVGYVLRNAYSGTEDSGEMEVIVLDK